MTDWICKEVHTDNGGYFEPVKELIRCKDCKWFVHDDDCYGDCSNEGGAKDFVYTNDFCSRAERKEE